MYHYKRRIFEEIPECLFESISAVDAPDQFAKKPDTDKLADLKSFLCGDCQKV